MPRLPTPGSKCLHHFPDLPAHYKILRIAKDALSAAHATQYSCDPSETHTAVSTPLCNLNCDPDLLWDEREAEVALQGSQVRISLYLIVGFRLRRSSFIDGKANLTDGSIPHAALRKTKEVGIG